MQEPLNQQPLNPADRELEAALRGLSPAAPSFSASDLFAAHLARARRRLILWRCASAALAASLALALFLRPKPPAPRVIVSGQNETAVQTIDLQIDSQSPVSYIALRHRLLNDAAAPMPQTRRSSKPLAPQPPPQRLLDNRLLQPNTISPEQL